MTTNATNPATQRSDQMLAAIAREALGLKTLKTRNAGHLDFHELAVWQVRKALRMAYAAGYEDAVSQLGAAIITCRAFDPAEEDEAYACAQRISGEVLSLQGHLLVVSANDAQRIDQAGGPQNARFIDDQDGNGTRTIAVGA